MLASAFQIVGLLLIVIGFALWMPALGLAALGGAVFLVANSLED